LAFEKIGFMKGLSGFYDARYGDKFEEFNHRFIYAEILLPLA